MASRFIAHEAISCTSFDIPKRISRIGLIKAIENTVKMAESRLNRKLRINCFLYGGIKRFKI